MQNRIYEVNGTVVMDVEVDGVVQRRPATIEMCGRTLTGRGEIPSLPLWRPAVQSNERLLEVLGGEFRIITVRLPD